MNPLSFRTEHGVRATEQAVRRRGTKAPTRQWFATTAGVALTLGMLVTGPGCGGSVENPVTITASIKTRRYTLSNGLDVILHRDISMRSVVVDVRYDVGAKDDPPSMLGLSHLVEHLTYRHRPDGARSTTQHLLETGATYNGTTSVEATEYYESVPEGALETALWLEASRMAHPVDDLDDASFEVERAVVENERRDRYENEPGGSVPIFALQALFGREHPYAQPPIGIDEDLRRMSLAAAKTFTARYYRPNNATLVVVGAFDEARIAELVEKHFGALPPGPAIRPRAIPIPRNRASMNIVEADVAAPSVTVAWLAPGAGTSGWPETLIAARMLGGTSAWRSKDVRAVETRVIAMQAASVVLLRADLAKGTRADTVAAALDRELGWLEESNRYVGDTKTRLIAQTTLAFEEPLVRARTIQDLVARYDDPDALQRELHAVSEVMMDSFNATLRRRFVEAPRTTMVVTPTSGAPRGGRWAQ